MIPAPGNDLGDPRVGEPGRWRTPLTGKRPRELILGKDSIAVLENRLPALGQAFGRVHYRRWNRLALQFDLEPEVRHKQSRHPLILFQWTILSPTRVQPSGTRMLLRWPAL